MENTFVNFIEIVGTFAFAVSGVRLASQKKFDWFGAYVVGLVTAIGGGTLRDLLLQITPFWMQDKSYLIVTAIALVSVILFGRRINRLSNTFFLFDSIGLALFVVVGMQKTLEADYPFWVAIVMGTITGSFGGVIRDILINEEPLIFRKDIYALACIIGGLCYWLFSVFGLSPIIVQSIAALAVITTRIIAVKYHLSLPTLSQKE